LKQRARSGPKRNRRGNSLLQIIAVILLVLSLLGLVTSYTLGGFIHVLLGTAISVVLVSLIQGRRLLRWVGAKSADQPLEH
jgi:uncharacterized membrane protein YccC